ncbi:MAG TPA: zinc-binding dehydrogenase [Acidimicrobiales bacterium]|jgi:NADPH:quinone reductase-like Zn-dependent oxidoreductase|nr:zinc-binding dehydrogenase [Acidimicrobiales bacterium]
MHAAVMRQFGPASVLKTEEWPERRRQPGWSRVRLKAAALNWHDVLVRRGVYSFVRLPHIPGADGAGITDDGTEVVVLPSIGWGTDERVPGPEFEILGDHRPGTYAEVTHVPTECLFPKPKGWDWASAAGLSLVGVTAHRALFGRGRLRPGESVLLLGAGGGLSVMAVMLAAAVGSTVFVTSSSPTKLERARSLGAAGGVLYTEPDWPQAARAASPGGIGFDLVIDPVGCWADSLAALRPGGRCVVLGAKGTPDQQLDARRFYFGQFDLLGTTMGSRADMVALLKLVDEGVLRPPPVDHQYPLDQVVAAHTVMESGEAFGKIVLNVG